MRKVIKKIILKLLPENILIPLRELIKKRKKRKLFIKLNKLESLTRVDFENILLNNICIKERDSIFIHAGLTNLHINISAEEIIYLLMNIVTGKGNILMPFYPLKSSYQFLLDGKPFDLRENFTSMGAIATKFSEMKGVKKSVHPTKSVAAWGQDRDDLINEHHLSILPYDNKSPYYKFINLHKSKIIGLGVTSKHLSCVHSAIDINVNFPIQPYYPNIMIGSVVDYNGNIVRISTYSHDPTIIEHEDVPRFLKETNCQTYNEYIIKGREFFVVNARELFLHINQQAIFGNTWFYPKELNYKQPYRIKQS